MTLKSQEYEGACMYSIVLGRVHAGSTSTVLYLLRTPAGRECPLISPNPTILYIYLHSYLNTRCL